MEVDLDETVARLRTRRENAGAGVSRLDMSFKGKGYGSKESKQFLMAQRKGDTSLHSIIDKVIRIIFTQMSAQQGIKKHGEKAIAAVFKEL